MIGEHKGVDAQRIMFKIGRPSPMRRSIASARRFCTITKWSVDPLDQTEGVDRRHTCALVSFIEDCLTMKKSLL